MARNFNVDDKALTETIRGGQATIFGEDLAMLESQQRNLTEQPNRHLMRLNIDMGGFESRRILERLVAEERNDLLRTQVSCTPRAGWARMHPGRRGCEQRPRSRTAWRRSFSWVALSRHLVRVVVPD